MTFNVDRGSGRALMVYCEKASLRLMKAFKPGNALSDGEVEREAGQRTLTTTILLSIMVKCL